MLAEVISQVPDEWLAGDVDGANGAGFADRAALDQAYADRLLARVRARATWLAALRATVDQAGTPVRTAAPRRRPTWLGGA